MDKSGYYVVYSAAQVVTQRVAAIMRNLLLYFMCMIRSFTPQYRRKKVKTQGIVLLDIP